MKHPCRLPTNSDLPVELFFLDLTVTPAALQQRWLSPAEQLRSSLFHRSHDRRRYLSAHCGLRMVLGTHIGWPPANLEYSIGEQGKPRLLCAPQVHFSLTYAGDTALVATSHHGPLGIDLETQRAVEDSEQLALLCFSRTEQSDLARTAPGPARDRAFLQGWTRKEACLKATGIGLSLDPASFTSGLGSEPVGVRLCVPEGETGVTVRTLELGPYFTGACALIDQ